MKKVTAYVNTTRVHWLVEELQAAGVREILVTEYFKPLSQVSRLELLCEDEKVGVVKGIVHRLGTMGEPADHDIIIRQHDAKRLQLLPMTIRLDPLEESRLKEFINKTFHAVRKRLVLTFSVVAFSVLFAALLVHLRIEGIQSAAREADEKARVVADAMNQIQTAHLDQLLAAERLHRGEMVSSLQQFMQAGARHDEAALLLKKFRSFQQPAIDSLLTLERRFQSIMSGMFELITRRNHLGARKNAMEIARLSQSHDSIMTLLDGLHWQSIGILASLEQEANDVAVRKEQGSEQALRKVRVSLTILTSLAFVMTIAMWLIARQKVTHPMQLLAAEAKAVDMEGLK